MLRSIAVYCGAGKPADPRLLEAARAFGGLLADRGIRLVYGGAAVGLMGALADGALERGGAVTGVLPAVIEEMEIAHRGLTETVMVPSMHARKAVMTERSDALVAMPGGIGTLDELFEAWTWRYLGIHDKPVGLYDVLGFYQGLVSFLDDVSRAGLLGERSRRLLVVRSSAEELLAALEQARG